MNKKGQKKVFEFLFWAAVIYVAVGVSLFMIQRTFMYFPSKVTQSRAVFNAQDMDIVTFKTEDGLSLGAWYKAPVDGKPIIVLFHGNASHMGISALKVRSFLDSGYGAFLPAYRGYAGNPGKPTEEGLYLDGRAAISWLLENGYQQSDIIIYGESLGTGVSIELASKYYKDVKGLVLESPYTSFIDLAKRTYFWLPLNLVMRDRYESIDKIAYVQAPIFIVRGGKDTLVPPAMGQRLFDAAKAEKQIKTLENSGHNDMHQNGVDQYIMHFVTGL